MEEGFLSRYAVIGLHEHYNPQSMVDDLYSHVDIQYSFMEDIFLHGKRSFTDAVADAFRFVDDQYVMVDLDMDAIEDLPSSAVTPSGISAMHARQYVNFAGSDAKVAGLHICEGAVRLDSGLEGAQTGKLIAYLVSDFIKANL
jgi:formiminoglutamase